MSLYFETIKYKEGKFHLLDKHEKRMNATRLAIYNSKHKISLSSLLKETPNEHGLYKCRVTYNDEVQNIVFTPYQMATHKTISLMSCGEYQYPFKSEDRDYINLAVKLSGCDDVLFLKDGELTDSSYANIALYDGEQWFTPETYIFNGVKRQNLIESGIIKPKEIRFVDLLSYKKIAFINAMRDFELVYNMKLRNEIIELTLVS